MTQDRTEKRHARIRNRLMYKTFSHKQQLMTIIDVQDCILPNKEEGLKLIVKNPQGEMFKFGQTYEFIKAKFKI